MTSEGDKHLPEDVVTSVYRAIVRLNLDRDLLVNAVPTTAYAQLVKQELYGPQVWSDLQVLNGLRSPVALQRWLGAALDRSAGSSDEDTFQAALHVLGAAPARPFLTGQLESFVHSSGGQSGANGANSARVQVMAARQDARIVARFRTHMAPLERHGMVSVDDPNSTLPGQVQRAPQQVAEDVDVVVVFLSADLFASIDEEHLRSLVDRSHLGKVRVIPVVARSCAWSSSVIGSLQVLPRSGRPLATSPDVDSELVEVALAVRAAAEDACRRRDPTTFRSPGTETRNLFLSDTTAPVVRPPAGTIRLEQIFRISGPPQNTYVDPKEMPIIRRELATNHTALLLEGPSQIGKSSAVARALGESPYVLITPSSRKSQVLAKQLVEMDTIDKHLFVDDANQLDPDLLLDIINLACRVCQQSSPRGKVIIVGPPGLSQRFPRHQRARFCQVTMGPQPSSVIEKLVELGEQASNLRFLHRSEIVLQAGGSLRLAQEICLRLAQKQTEVAAPSSVLTITGHPDEVQPIIFQDLPFHEPLRRFVTKCESGLAAVAVLAALVGRPTGIRFSDVANRNPALRTEIRLLSESIASSINEDPELGEFLVASSQELVVADPRLSYWLSQRQLQQFAQSLFIEARISDDLRVIVPAQAASIEVRSVAADWSASEAHWLDTPKYPLQNADAYQLYTILGSAFSSISQLKVVAEHAGVALGYWDNEHGVAPACLSLLDIAAHQGKLRSLLEAIFADENTRGWHPKIRAIVEKDLLRPYKEPTQTMKFPIASGSVDIFNTENTLVGYAYVEGSDMQDYRQRWVLLPGYVFPPMAVARFQGAAEERRFGSVAEWTDHVAATWQPGSLYVEAYCEPMEQVHIHSNVACWAHLGEQKVFAGMVNTSSGLGPESLNASAETVPTFSGKRVPPKMTIVEEWTMLADYMAPPHSVLELGPIAAANVPENVAMHTKGLIKVVCNYYDSFADV